MVAIRCGTFCAQIDPGELLDHPIPKTRRLLMLMCDPEDYSDAVSNRPQILKLIEELRELEKGYTLIFDEAKAYERDNRIPVPADKRRSRKPEWVKARERNRNLLEAVHAAAREIEKVKKQQRLLYEAIANSGYEEIKEIVRI